MRNLTETFRLPLPESKFFGQFGSYTIRARGKDILLVIAQVSDGSITVQEGEDRYLPPDVLTSFSNPNMDMALNTVQALSVIRTFLELRQSALTAEALVRQMLSGTRPGNASLPERTGFSAVPDRQPMPKPSRPNPLAKAFNALRQLLTNLKEN
jgi:hypothetical protein